MSEPFVYDSRCGVCKTPFGAVSCGAGLTLHTRPLAAEGFTHCSLILRAEFAGWEAERELTPGPTEGDRIRFDVTFPAPEEPDLLWYHFRFWREDGSGCYLDRTGYRSEGDPANWQLTVYRETTVPEWFGRGVTYQIFPDRFCRLTIPNPTGLPGDRTVHQSWEDLPDWRPDSKGEIHNRDFFGGSLPGITSKLDELAELGVTTLYLCPIFESASNHRYNTANYMAIDPFLGTEEDFRNLCTEAERRGIRVLLDGVFNHTGSQSIYFNADGWYSTTGAAQSRESPWYGWYRFTSWPDEYDSWWGIRTLPAVEESAPSYVDYIIDGPDSVIRYWLRAGASGWRLDVADELPDWFIAKIRAAMDETKSGSVLLGEVWEDGSNKIAYSLRRRYLLGSEAHGLMNYPFRSAALNWLKGGDAGEFREAMETIRENYPRSAFYSAMNFLGTHDPVRILTELGAGEVPQSRDGRALYHLTAEERRTGTELLKVAALLLFTFPGSPTVYYGDEAGMEGFEDPFNRGTYPWGREDESLKAWFTRLGWIRRKRESLQSGAIEYLFSSGAGLAFCRQSGCEISVTALNAGTDTLTLVLPWEKDEATDAMTGRTFFAAGGTVSVELRPRSGALLL